MTIAELMAILAGIGGGVLLYARVIVPILHAIGIDPAPLERALFVDTPDAPDAPDTPDAPDAPRDAQGDRDVPRDAPRIAPRITPGDRDALIRALVVSGWSVAQIRATLVGGNAEIGAQVAAARAALGVPEPPRTVTIRNGRDGEVEL